MDVEKKEKGENKCKGRLKFRILKKGSSERKDFALKEFMMVQQTNPNLVREVILKLNERVGVNSCHTP